MSNGLWQTSDFGLATAILTSGFELVGVDRGNPRRVYFMFNKSDEIEDCVTRYWNGKLLLPANAYMDSIKHLKALIYS